MPDPDRFETRLSRLYASEPAVDVGAQRRILERVDRDIVGRRSGSWLMRLRIPLPAAAALAVTLMGVGLGLGWSAARLRGVDRHGVRPAGGVSIVRFAYHAPGAHSVALVGDFNGWDPEATPLDRQAPGGAWSARVALPPGVHAYGFLVDGRGLVPDPDAYRASAFGERSVVIVPRPDGT
jgi:hypothetical protein